MGTGKEIISSLLSLLILTDIEPTEIFSSLSYKCLLSHIQGRAKLGLPVFV